MNTYIICHTPDRDVFNIVEVHADKQKADDRLKELDPKWGGTDLSDYFVEEWELIE